MSCNDGTHYPDRSFFVGWQWCKECGARRLEGYNDWQMPRRVIADQVMEASELKNDLSTLGVKHAEHVQALEKLCGQVGKHDAVLAYMHRALCTHFGTECPI